MFFSPTRKWNAIRRCQYFAYPYLFYGLESGEETVLSFEDNRQAIVHYLATSEPDEEGMRRVFFELNGQPQTVIVRDNNLSYEVHQNEKADPANPGHLGAPMPGLVVTVEVTAGERIRQGDTVVVLEAMKMQSAIPRREKRHYQTGRCQSDTWLTAATCWLRLSNVLCTGSETYETFTDGGRNFKSVPFPRR